MDGVDNKPICGEILDSIGKTRVHWDPWTNPRLQIANVPPKVGWNVTDRWIRVVEGDLFTIKTVEFQGCKINDHEQQTLVNARTLRALSTWEGGLDKRS